MPKTSEPFGSMPADAELAAFGVGVAGLMLGLFAADVVFAAIQGRAAPFSAATWPWLSVLLAVAVLVAAAQVTGTALRVALISFAAAELLSLHPVAILVPVSPWLAMALHATFGCALLVAAWPRAGRVARLAAVVLFLAAAAFRTLLVYPR